MKRKGGTDCSSFFCYKDYKLNLTGDNVISTAGLFISPENNDIYVGGFCKDKDKLTDGDNSIFFSKLDITTGSLNSKVHPFSKEFLDGMVKNKKIEKGDGIVNFSKRQHKKNRNFPLFFLLNYPTFAQWKISEISA